MITHPWWSIIMEANKILLIDNDGKVQVGTPVIKNTIVTASVISHLKGDKVKVFKKKRRKGYQVLNGHRQYLTELLIERIGEGTAKSPVKAGAATKPDSKAKKEEVKAKPEAKKDDAKSPVTEEKQTAPAKKTTTKTASTAKKASTKPAAKSATDKKTEAKPATKSTATNKAAAKPAAKTPAAKKTTAKPAAKSTTAKKTTAKPAAKAKKADDKKK